MADPFDTEDITAPSGPAVEWWATPGGRREREVAVERDQRTQFGSNLVAGFKDTALSDVLEVVDDELTPLLEETGGSLYNPIDRIGGYIDLMQGERAGGVQDYSDQYDTLTAGVPSRFHEEILYEPNAEAAGRARARIDAQLERARVSAVQQGITPQLAMLAGQIIDLDAPLMLATGGGYKAAVVARNAIRAANRMGLSPKAALRMSSAAVGASSGLQSGLIVGGAQSVIKETADWTLVAESALAGVVLGGAANPLLGGDIRLGALAAQDELYKRMAKDDPSLRVDAAVDPASADRLYPADHTGPVMFDEDGNEARMVDSTVGAQMVTPTPGAPVTPMDGNLTDAVKDIGTMSDNWRHDSDWQDWKVADNNEWWAGVALSGAFNLTTRNFRELYRSDSSTLNFMLGNIFESPNGMGRGKFTAAAGMEMYHRRIAHKFTTPLKTEAVDWARRNGTVRLGAVPAQESLLAFNREVMAEMNDRMLQRAPVAPRDPAIIRAADALDAASKEAHGIAQGRSGQLAVDGFDNIPARSGYSPQVWKGTQIQALERSGRVTRRAIVQAMTTAYRNAGMDMAKDARAVAEAVVARSVAGADEVDTSLVALLSGDGREWLNDSLQRNGMPEAQRGALLTRLTGNVEERGKEGFSKMRNDIDTATPVTTTDGSNLQIMDLMDRDIHGVWQRYTRRLSGSAALARVGITNRAQREQFITAAQAQQRALGEDVVDGDTLRAMLSHFNGGPVHGKGLGSYEQGVMPEAALVKRMTNLSLLGKLGMAQAAETGASVASVGLRTWLDRGPMALFRKELKTANDALLADLSFITGELGRDQHMFAEHLDLDDMNVSDRHAMFTFAQGLSQKASYIQGYVSLFNTVRGAQQKTAALGITDKVFRAIKTSVDTGAPLPDSFVSRARADLGLFPDDLVELEQLVTNGTVEFATNSRGQAYVNRINADRWDADMADRFGATITRHVNQVVQKSMAGEQDAWMHTTLGSLLTHLKTFPLQAMQKQFIRNARHTDMQSLNLVYMGMATAAAAVMIKDAIDGKERSVADTARSAFGYSNLTGWVPMVVDPTLTMLGMEDHRINAFGPHSDITPASLSWANNALRLPGALVDTATGEADYYDRQSIKALPFMNILGLSRITD